MQIGENSLYNVLAFFFLFEGKKYLLNTLDGLIYKVQ